MNNVREFLNFPEPTDEVSKVSELKLKGKKKNTIFVDDINSDEFIGNISLILAFERQWNKANPNEEWCCINDLIESKLTPKQKKILLDQIQAKGFPRLKEAFWNLNKACETMLCEPEDLFGIFKRRIFNHPDPLDDNDRLYYVGKYLNLTLMHFKLLKNRDRLPLFVRLQSSKSEAISIILPILRTVTSFLEGKFEFKKING